MTYIREHSNLPNMTFVLVNKYADGKDSVSAHSDDEQSLVKDDPIFSLSIGTTRTFTVRPVLNETKKSKKSLVNLGPYNPGASSLFTHPTVPYDKISVEIKACDNLLIVMAGKRFQTDFVHEVKKDNKCVGTRWNFTFRSMA
jgi:hypothetical protein